MRNSTRITRRLTGGSGGAPLGAERWHRRVPFREKLRGCDGTRKTHLPLGFAAQLRKAFGPQWVEMHYTEERGPPTRERIFYTCSLLYATCRMCRSRAAPLILPHFLVPQRVVTARRDARRETHLPLGFAAQPPNTFGPQGLQGHYAVYLGPPSRGRIFHACYSVYAACRMYCKYAVQRIYDIYNT